MENLIKNKADELMENADKKAAELAEEARKKAEQLADEARKKAARLREEAREKARKLNEKISQTKDNVKSATRSAADKFISAAVVTFGGIFIMKFLLKEYASYSHTKKVNDALDSAIKKGESAGKPLSYSQPEYTQFANMIQQATAGAGTDTQIIYQVFGKMQNDTDILQLIQTYGKRPNSWLGIPMGNFTLSQLLISELSSRERKQLNDILAQKGITITF